MVDGRLLATQQLRDTDTYLVQKSTFASGIYMVVLETENGAKSTQKIRL